MSCLKCKAQIGVMKHEVQLDAGVLPCSRCVICGYWSQPYYPPFKRQYKDVKPVVAM